MGESGHADKPVKRGLFSALSLNRFGGLMKASGVGIGTVHQWHTGPGGKKEPWIRQREGWVRVAEMAPGAKVPEESGIPSHGKSSVLRDAFLDFVSDKKHLFTEDEIKSREQALRRKEYLWKQLEETAASGLDAPELSTEYMQAAEKVITFEKERCARTLSLLKSHNPAEITVKDVPKSVSSALTWLSEDARKASETRIRQALESMKQLQEYVDKDVYESLSNKAVVIDAGDFSLYDPKGLRGTKHSPIDYEGPVVVLHRDKVSSSETNDDDLHHEYMHHLWYNSKDIREKVREFFDKRTRGEVVAVENSKLIGEFNYKRDKWEDLGGREYTGRVYPSAVGDSKEGSGMEVLSCGMERLMKDPELFAKRDPEFFDLVISCVRGW